MKCIYIHLLQIKSLWIWIFLCSLITTAKAESPMWTHNVGCVCPSWFGRGQEALIWFLFHGILLETKIFNNFYLFRKRDEEPNAILDQNRNVRKCTIIFDCSYLWSFYSGIPVQTLSIFNHIASAFTKYLMPDIRQVFKAHIKIFNASLTGISALDDACVSPLLYKTRGNRQRYLISRIPIHARSASASWIPKKRDIS